MATCWRMGVSLLLLKQNTLHITAFHFIKLIEMGCCALIA